MNDERVTQFINLEESGSAGPRKLKIEKAMSVGHYMTPSSSIANLVKSVFEAGGTRRPLEVSKNADVSSKSDLYGNMTCNYTSKSDSYEVSIDNYERVFTRQDKNTRKVFNFLLQKFNQTKSEKICFSLDEIVERGMYKSKESARLGVDRCVAKLMSIRLKGTAKKGRKTVGIERCQLVMKSSIYNSSWVLVDKELYSFMSQYFTVLPVWGDALKSSKAYSILDYIYFRARQELRGIKSKGYFNISLDTLNRHLAQMSPDQTKDHAKLIINPILDAITEIEDVQKEHFEDGGQGISLKITPHYNSNYSGAQEFLAGHLKVELDESTIDYFSKLCTKHEKKIASEMKRQRAYEEKVSLANEMKI